jgi:uncharacterized protein YkwD
MRPITFLILLVVLVQVSLSSSYEDSIIAEMNLVRENPEWYADNVITPYLNNIKWRRCTQWCAPAGVIHCMLQEDGSGGIHTREGKEAIQECIRVLKRTAPVGPLTLSNGLSRSARDHVQDRGPKGMMGHISSNGEDLRDRINRYIDTDSRGTYDTTYTTGAVTLRDGFLIAGGQRTMTIKTTGPKACENIDYGSRNPRNVVLSLLIDDGVASRGHRDNILREDISLAGVASGYHRTYGVMCVIDYLE